MGSYARINVPLSNEEWKMLKSVADKECREPRQQARYMLKQLLSQKSEETGHGANQVPVSSTQSANGANR